MIQTVLNEDHEIIVEVLKTIRQSMRKADKLAECSHFPLNGEMHLEAARRLGVPFSECLVIEDSVTAIALAKRNGAGRIVGVGETADGSELLALGADHYIHDFTEFDYGWLEN